MEKKEKRGETKAKENIVKKKMKVKVRRIREGGEERPEDEKGKIQRGGTIMWKKNMWERKSQKEDWRFEEKWARYFELKKKMGSTGGG